MAGTVVQPEGWRRGKGYSHGMVAKGRHVFIGGQIGWNGQFTPVEGGFLEQFQQALQNVVAVVVAAGGSPQDIVRLRAFINDEAAYRAAKPHLGPIYTDIMKRNFPTMSFIGVSWLDEPWALVEIEANAVLPEGGDDD